MPRTGIFITFPADDCWYTFSTLTYGKEEASVSPWSIVVFLSAIYLVCLWFHQIKIYNHIGTFFL